MRRIEVRKRTDHEAAEAWRQERLAHGSRWHDEAPSSEQLELLSALLNLRPTVLSSMRLTKLSACFATEMAYKHKPENRSREAENILEFARHAAEEAAQLAASEAEERGPFATPSNNHESGILVMENLGLRTRQISTPSLSQLRAEAALLYRLRAGDGAVIERLASKVCSLLRGPCVLVPVPNHLPSSLHDQPLRQLCLLSGNSIQLARCETLQRHRAVTAASSGRRGAQAHLDSVRVRTPQHIAGKTAVLIDDYCVTGNTLRACGQLLKEAGARRVFRLALFRLHDDRLVPPLKRPPAPSCQAAAVSRQELPAAEANKVQPSVKAERPPAYRNHPRPYPPHEGDHRPLTRHPTAVDHAPGPEYFRLCAKYGTIGQDCD